MAKLEKNINLSISTAVSWLNVFDLPSLSLWLLNKKICHLLCFKSNCFSIVHFPQSLNLAMIPDVLKSDAVFSILKAEEILNQCEFKEKMGIENLISFRKLIEKNHEITKTQIIYLINQIEVVDKFRKQFLNDYIPLASRVLEYYKKSITDR